MRMSEKYLFAAEADKIQDLVFRSSKLREVSGGSQMLEDFCQNTTKELVERFNGEVIISSGGSFRILFDKEEAAKEFGEYLTELYRREFDGTITTAGPLKIGSEKEAINEIQHKLRKAKHSGRIPVAIEQMPYMAICGSCGIGIAKYFKKRHADEKENYLCAICEKKSRARDRIKETFLAQFYSCVVNDTQRGFDFPQEVNDLSQLEARNYIAYLIADVNDMGVIFGSCESFNHLKELSNDLNDVLWQSLAEPTKKIMQIKTESPNFIPVLPLILGGDDLFALIPAQWALDFTRCFCEKFEEYMEQALRGKSDFCPTVSAAVIICKEKFPYLFAHTLGEELLNTTKKIAKENKSSAISFHVVTGNEIVKAPKRDQTFIAGYPAYSLKELKSLLDYRKELSNLPGRRRAQLQNLFYKAEELDYLYSNLPFKRMQTEWLPEIEELLQRLEQPLSEKLRKALRELGDPDSDTYWQMVNGKYRHRLPDLLSAWDFTYDLNTNPLDEEAVE